MLNPGNPYYGQMELLVALLPRIAHEPRFALKGGTAINLFLRDLPRLSVDIDLVYLSREGREEGLAGIRDGLTRVARRIESELAGAKARPVLTGGTLTKLNVQRGNVNVKIEVSPTLRGTVHPPETRAVSKSVQNAFGYAEFPLLHSDEIFAGKLCAALDRQHPRDLFDVRILLEEGGPDGGLVEIFLVYLISGNRPLAEMLDPAIPEKLEDIYENQFIGMALQSASLDELRVARTELLTRLHQRLTDKHRRFLLSFKQGNPEWELLRFGDLAELPAIRWKLQNLAKMDPIKRRQALDKLERVLTHGPSL